ncbi:MAG: tRNA pseudouridine(38-40) synthase TruA, partial [Ruthenibacterium sp.]
QQNALSVCEVLQNAMEKLYGARPPVKGCSRTDAGVHALGYCVSYRQPKPIELFRLPLAINRFLPPDIRVLSAREVPDDFHARYDALSKEYLYKLHNSAVDDVFAQDTAWRLATPLDVEIMQQTAQLLCGTHDYTAFMSAGSKIEDAVRTVHFFTVKKDGCDITFHICADGYLYNMVRILVGTLVEVGAHRMTPQQAAQLLEERDRARAGDTAPARGLFLYRVNYTSSERDGAVQDAAL